MRAKRRYRSDLTDRQWVLIEPLLPERPAGPAGRPAAHREREIVNAILYIARAGCSWRMLPKDFPPWQTVYGYFRDWRTDGTLDRVHDALRKRHIVVDTIGLLLVVMVSAASVQDRDGARPTLKRLHGALGSVRHIWADGGYSGQLLAVAKSAWQIVVEIVRKPADQIGFAVLPRRWVLERTLSWLMRWRRLARDYERLPETHEAFVK